jgi:hypothetical protein
LEVTIKRDYLATSPLIHCMSRLVDLSTLYLGVTRRLFPILTTGLFSTQGRQRLSQLYATLAPPSGEVVFPEDPFIIKKTDILALMGNDPCTYEGVDECGFGHITEFELKVLCNVVKLYQPKTLFEIGTFEGRTTLNMALNTAEDARIYTLDLPSSELDSTQMEIEAAEVAYVKKTVSGARFLNHPVRTKIKQLLGDSATFDYTPYRDQMDFVFVDGSHAYDYVLSDTRKAIDLIKPTGGVILWHDYTNWLGVQQGLNELYRQNPVFGRLKHIGGTSIVMLALTADEARRAKASQGTTQAQGAPVPV